MQFKVKFKNSSGAVTTADREAVDKFDLYKQVKAEGGDVISVTESSHAKFSLNNLFPRGIGGVKTHDKILFARNLGAMIEAGLSVSRALSVMERQAKQPQLKEVLQSIQTNISQGKTLSDSMKLWPKVFSQLFVSMVHAGEESGTLANALKVVALQMDKIYAMQRKIRGALMYPSVILFAMIVIAILMLTYIVPTLMKTFTDMKVELPATTRFVLLISELVQHQGLLLLLIFGVIFGGIYYFARTEVGKKFFHLAVLKLPIIGNIIRQVNAARTARTLSSLLNSGVEVVESVKITSEVIQNYYYRRVLVEATESISKGELMSKVFTANEKLYPVFLAEMMAVGEETGKISEMLMGVATFYEDEVDQKTKDMSTIVEPFLMIFIAIGVGFFAVAMISPMYSLVNVI